MAVSVFDLFTIGIGPSSSHTVGPMRAARQFVLALQASGRLARVSEVRVHLYGSLAATGRGHGSHRALMLGLEGETPEEIDVDRLPARIALITDARRLNLLGRHAIPFDPGADLVFEPPADNCPATRTACGSSRGGWRRGSRAERIYYSGCRGARRSSTGSWPGSPRRRCAIR